MVVVNYLFCFYPNKNEQRSVYPGFTNSVVDSDWLAAGRTISTSSDGIHSNGVIYSRLKARDGCRGDISRYSELLSRPSAPCKQEHKIVSYHHIIRVITTVIYAFRPNPAEGLW